MEETQAKHRSNRKLKSDESKASRATTTTEESRSAESSTGSSVSESASASSHVDLDIVGEKLMLWSAMKADAELLSDRIVFLSGFAISAPTRYLGSMTWQAETFMTLVVLAIFAVCMCVVCMTQIAGMLTYLGKCTSHFPHRAMVEVVVAHVGSLGLLKWRLNAHRASDTGDRSLGVVKLIDGVRVAFAELAGDTMF